MRQGTAPGAYCRSSAFRSISAKVACCPDGQHAVLRHDPVQRRCAGYIDEHRLTVVFPVLHRHDIRAAGNAPAVGVLCHIGPQFRGAARLQKHSYLFFSSSMARTVSRSAGRVSIRAPSAADIALVMAGATIEVAGSPMPCTSSGGTPGAFLQQHRPHGTHIQCCGQQIAVQISGACHAARCVGIFRQGVAYAHGYTAAYLSHRGSVVNDAAHVVYGHKVSYVGLSGDGVYLPQRRRAP